MIITLSLVICLIVVTADQLTKILLMDVSFTYIPYVLYNVPTLNDGAAFSMLSGARVFFIIFTTIVLFIIGIFLFTNKFSKSIFFKLTLGVLAGGILGNFIDRYFIGSVRDFLYLEPFGFICNIADVAICVGTAMLCIYIIFMHKFKSNAD
ncbi:MAG: signal peptidase II [Clostridia bacterium]|nr:signal peptidase II [Clostridia bacterium]